MVVSMCVNNIHKLMILIVANDQGNCDEQVDKNVLLWGLCPSVIGTITGTKASFELAPVSFVVLN